MGAWADSLFTILLGWVRSAVSAIMTAFSSGGESGFLNFLGRHWLPVVLVIIAIGLVGDWFIWMVRWQPYRVWGTRLRRMARLFGGGDAQESAARDEQADMSTEAPEVPMEDTAFYQMSSQYAADEAEAAPEEAPLPVLEQEDEAAAYEAAGRIDDAVLGDYPGQRYDMNPYMRPVQTDIPAQETADGYAPEAPSPYGAEEETGWNGEAAYASWPEETAPELEQIAPQPAGDERDVEFAGEFDPLAAYDDPEVLRRFMRPQEEPQSSYEAYEAEGGIEAGLTDETPDEGAYMYGAPETAEAPFGLSGGAEEVPQRAWEQPAALADVPPEGSRRRRRRRAEAQGAYVAEETVIETDFARQGAGPADVPPEDTPLNTTWDPPLSPREQAQRVLSQQAAEAQQRREGGRLSVLGKLLDGTQEEKNVLPPRVDYREAFKPPVAPDGWHENDGR